MNKLFSSLLTALVISLPAISMAIEPSEKIYVDADRMQANIESGQSVYTGNVKVTQGELVLTGDRLTVKQSGNEVERIIVTGKPARYRHVTESGEIIKASSGQMVYIAANNTLILTVDAQLQHPEHQISSQRIVYNTVTKIAVAGNKNSAGGDDDDKEQVRITLTPKQDTSEQ